MANNDGFGSSEMMYPAVPVTGGPPNPMVPAALPAIPAFGGPALRGPEIIHGAFNQTWLLNCLRRRWLMALFLGALSSLLIGALLLWLFPLSSSITALVHIQQEDTNPMETKKHFSLPELEFFQENQLAMIKSQLVLQTALTPNSISQLEAVKKEEPDPITWLQDNLKVNFYGDTLQIRYDGEEDSKEMKKVIDAVIDTYKRDVLNASRTRSAVMRENLADFHKDMADELEAKMLEYETMSAELGGVEDPNTSTLLNMLLNDVRQIQSQIMKKKEELVNITVTKTVAEQQARSTSALEQAVSETMEKDPTIANLRTEEYTISQQIRLLQSTAKNGTSASIKQLQRSLGKLQQQLQQYRITTEAATRKALKNAPNDYLTAVLAEYRLRRDSITTDLQTLQLEHDTKVEDIEQKGERSGKLLMMASEIEQLQEVEKDLEYKVRSWGIQDQTSGQLFHVLQPATSKDKINTWQRYTLASLGGIAAFCATCYGVALIEFRRRRLNGASDMDEGFGVRVLGVLPSVSSRKAMASGGAIAAQLSESIDNVRATLLHDSAKNKRQVVLITSPATMEGTTTVASHLALSLTRAGRRTLLVDGDIREPALHKLFGLPLDDGFCEVLRTDIDVSDAIRPTNTEGLWLLTAGHCDMDAVHALATDQPQPIFEKLREEFDFIIIDGAPVLGLADSISIGQHVDGAILTVLRDHSEVRQIHQAMELLKSMGIRLLGSVVNGVRIKADRRVTQMQKSPGKKPRKLASEPAATATKTQVSPAPTKAEKPVTESNDIVDDFKDDLQDGIKDLGLSDDLDIDFEGFDIDGKS